MCLYILSCESLWAQGEGNEVLRSPGQIWNEVNLLQRLDMKQMVRLDFFQSGGGDAQDPRAYFKYNMDMGTRFLYHYFITPNWRWTSGVGYWYYPPVPSAGQTEKHEWRYLTDIQYTWRKGRWTVLNRPRVEFRHMKEAGNKDPYWNNRFRYMIKSYVGLNSKTIRAKSLYGILGEELYLNLDKDKELFNQNRFVLGLGYSFTDDISLELSWVHRTTQTFVIPDGTVKDNMNALSVALSINNVLSAWRKK